MCEIPFDFDGVDNNFCVDNNGEIECHTGDANFAKCYLGRFLIFKPFEVFGEKENVFRSTINFKSNIELQTKVTYDFSFYLLINSHSCAVEDLRLSLFLVDDEYFFQDLFASNDTSVDLKPNKWNFYENCFTVIGRAYKFNILAENLCENDKVFLALDDLLLKKSNKAENECLNIQITEKPETTTKVTTVLPTTESLTTESPSTESPAVSSTEFDTTMQTEPTLSTEQINPGFFSLFVLFLLI